MITFIRNLFVGAMLSLSQYIPQHRQAGVLQDTEQGELEPVKQMDEWNSWLHHDDVTKEEEAMLFSDDPEQIKMAQEQIAIRTAEADEFFKSDRCKEVFQAGYLKDADWTKPQTPMHEREGWEDDDMPETFIGISPVTGDIEEIAFDELEEWRQPDNKITCYQCEQEVNYLFEDARCHNCTRLTPEEVTGDI